MSVTIRDPADAVPRDASMRTYISRSCEICGPSGHVGPAHTLVVDEAALVGNTDSFMKLGRRKGDAHQ